LLVDYEKRKIAMESVGEEIKELQERYAILSQQLNKTKAKTMALSNSQKTV